MITVNNITFRYPGTKRNVFEDFSLKFEENRIYGLLGKNGMGKSTMLYPALSVRAVAFLWPDNALFSE